MSNYTISVDWAGKDALSDSDAAKVISGADFNTEFTAVQTAVNTKAEINGAAAETFSATTATSGTNTTQVATTEYVTTAVAAVDLTTVYPIGSIYMNATSSTNPATLLGMASTTWVEFGEGRMLLGENSSHANGSTGGAETHTLTTAEMPSHEHNLDKPFYWDTGSLGSLPSLWGDNDNNTSAGLIKTDLVGGGNAHNNLPPYLAVYMWKRTA
jgi:hypothetical protein